MTILVRQITDKDMETISEWFVHMKWPLPPSKGILPPTGYVAEKDGVLHAVSWLYITNSRLALIEWTATNPDSGVMGFRGLKKIFDHMKKISEGVVDTFVHFVHSKRFAKYLENRAGFQRAESASLMIMRRK